MYYKSKEFTGVYLDTNILIGGNQKEEHKQLKLRAKKGQFVLYKSFHGDIEKHGRASRALHARNSLLSSSGIYNSDEKFAQFKEARDKYERELESEDREDEYWIDTPIMRSTSPFDVHVTTKGMLPDNEGLGLLGKLLDSGVGEKDSMHLMSAHSSGVDYFLTWDKPLINKCKKNLWLCMRVITPTEFLLETNLKKSARGLGWASIDLDPDYM